VGFSHFLLLLLLHSDKTPGTWLWTERSCKRLRGSGPERVGLQARLLSLVCQPAHAEKAPSSPFCTFTRFHAGQLIPPGPQPGPASLGLWVTSGARTLGGGVPLLVQGDWAGLGAPTVMKRLLTIPESWKVMAGPGEVSAGVGRSAGLHWGSLGWGIVSAPTWGPRVGSGQL
uniref:Uncharacterized protein n=1 Tax=Sus scrofa TaxID=9823 RepID=A0A8D1WM38_PIG